MAWGRESISQYILTQWHQNKFGFWSELIEAFIKSLHGCYYNCDLELDLTLRLVNDIIATHIELKCSVDVSVIATNPWYS